MISNLHSAGAASEELARKAHQWWRDAAAMAGVNVEGFDPDASLEERVAAAHRLGLEIGTSYNRYSSRMQHSTEDQVRENVTWAAWHGVYVPPETICVDEEVSGKKSQRPGLDRTRQILSQRLATVLLVYKVSRLFRQAGEGFRFFQTELVDAGLRGVSCSQQIDTSDKKSWKLQLQIHGIMDDLLLESIADHVRTGLAGTFLNGWTTGALGVGYRAKPDPDAPRTNRGLVRTRPEVDPVAADLIRRHVALHLDGMSISEGLRRWNAAGGPCDPRSTKGRMTYTAYRRLLSNERLTGRWEFGRKRNQFSVKSDYTKQVEQPDSEVLKVQYEELRILDDNTFYRLQALLNSKKTGPRGPRKRKKMQLWDVTTEMFFCPHCSTPGSPVRYHQAGADGRGMHCRNDMCNHRSLVRRQDAVLAICGKLSEIIARDDEIVEAVAQRSCEQNCAGDDELRREIAATERKVRGLSHQIEDLYDVAGHGSDTDRRETKARIRSVQSERQAAQGELARLKKVLQGTSTSLTPENVRETLSNMADLLREAACGELGEDSVYKALSAFRKLTGGQIWVHVDPRPGRKQKNLRGVFHLQLLRAIKEHAGSISTAGDSPREEISVWLRKPPRLDAIAERAHDLIDNHGQSYRDAAKTLQAEGYNVNSGNVWYSYRRWYEMQEQPVPKVPYNNGRRRRSA